MSVTALFRGKWGLKSQETPEKHAAAAAVVQQSYELDDDEDDSKSGFSREPIRRNSRFYRSVRKKRPVSSENSESKKPSGLCCTCNVTFYFYCASNWRDSGLCKFKHVWTSTECIGNINRLLGEHHTAIS